jgi:hypothetical protein
MSPAMALRRLLGSVVFACVASSANAQASADELLFWESVRNSKSAVELQAYLDHWPNGVFAPIARNRIADLSGKPAATTVPKSAPPAAPVSAPQQVVRKILVLSPAAIEADATGNENIKRQCIDDVASNPLTAKYESPQDNSPPGSETPVLAPLTIEVVAQTARFLTRRVAVEEIQDLEKVGEAHVLRLKIVDIEGKMGGIFSGRKSMTVTAELLQNGNVLRAADFTRRTTVAAAVGADTCRSLARTAGAIGRDVADWVIPVLARMNAPVRSNSGPVAPAPVR